MCKGWKLYGILALNEKGEEKGLENLPIVQEFVDVFPEELQGFSLERELGVYHRYGTWNWNYCKNSLPDVDIGIVVFEN